jgi:hypothetical protein
VGVVRERKVVLGFIPDRVKNTVFSKHTMGCCLNKSALVLGSIPDRVMNTKFNKHTRG